MQIEKKVKELIMVPNHSLAQDPFRSILYKLNRFFFIVFPFNLLFMKLIGIPEFTFWKDAIITVNVIYLVLFIPKDKFIVRYIALIILSLVIDIILGRIYFEHVLWLASGFPVYNYLKNVTIRDWDTDITILIILMCLGSIWIFFFESRGSYSYFFVPEKEGFTMLRGDGIRTRYCFISPMAMSQFCWFTLCLLFVSPRLNKYFKIISYLLVLYMFFMANTRAAYLLLGISVVIYVVDFFYKLNKWIIYTLVILGTLTVILQMISSASVDSDTALSDAIRLSRIQKGLTSIKINWIFGLGGERFSPRSIFFLGVSNFENSWISLMYCFGILGLFVIILIVTKIFTITTDLCILLFSVPWVIYSSLFPILQEHIPIYITWVIIAFSSNYKKVFILTNYTKEMVKTLSLKK